MRKKYRDREKNRNMIGREKERGRERKKVREIHNKGGKRDSGRESQSMEKQNGDRNYYTKRLPCIL